MIGTSVMKKLMNKAVVLRLNDLLVATSITDSKLLQLPKIATAEPNIHDKNEQVI